LGISADTLSHSAGLVFAIGLISATAVVRADTLTTINFDAAPSLTAGTNLDQYARPAQTILVPVAATINAESFWILALHSTVFPA
jgi:hypothetical protein